MGRDSISIYLERRQLEAQRAERLEVRTNESAYREGVDEVSGDPVIFLDTDVLRYSQSGPPGKMASQSETPGSELRQQMEPQVRGSSAALRQRFTDAGFDVGIDTIAAGIRGEGPAAISNINIDGNSYGLALLPPDHLSSREEIVRGFLGNYDTEVQRTFLANMPGTIAQWMRAFGNHEGQHLNDSVDSSTPLGVLIGETNADRIMHAHLLERGEGDIALAIRDLRSLTAARDPTHASGPLLNSTIKPTQMHIDAALNHRDETNAYVQDHFDWTGYRGSATTPDALLLESPEVYFVAAQLGLDQLQADALAAYNSDPTNHEALGDVIQAQIMIDYQKNFEDAWRRRILGQDIPEREPTALVSQEVVDSYYVEQLALDRIQSEEIELQVSADENEFSYKTMFENFDWEAHEGTATAWYELDNLERHQYMATQLDGIREQLLSEHAQNPSYEMTERLLKLESVINDHNTMIDIYSEDQTGIKPPERTPVVLVTEDARHAYYVERIEREDQQTAPSASQSIDLGDFTGPDAVYAGDARLRSEASAAGVATQSLDGPEMPVPQTATTPQMIQPS